MKKQLFSTAAAGMLLVASTGAAGAIISTPTGVSGFLSITGFEDANPSTYTASFTGLTGTIGFTDTVLTNGHVKLVIPPTTPPNPPAYIDPSAIGPTPPNPSVDPIFIPPGAYTVFAGSGSADFPVDSVTFDGTNSPSIVAGDQFSFTYTGVLSLFGVLLNNPALNTFINGSLTGTVPAVGVTPNSLTIDFTEVCNTPPAGPAGGSCIYEILHALNLSGSTPTDDTVTAAFGFPAGTSLVVPEPASLALMGIGIAGLGIARRKKAA